MQESFKPGRKALTELVGLCGSTTKDLKGAVQAAQKRLQQDQNESAKRRKVAAAASAEAKPEVTLWQFIQEGDTDRVKQLIIGKKVGDDGENDLWSPFLVNIPKDMDQWPPLLELAGKVLGDFRIEFEGSPLRASIGRAQKGFDKIASDPNLAKEIRHILFDQVIPPEKESKAKLSDELRSNLDLQCFGLAKNVACCVPGRATYQPSVSL